MVCVSTDWCYANKSEGTNGWLWSLCGVWWQHQTLSSVKAVVNRQATKTPLCVIKTHWPTLTVSFRVIASVPITQSPLQSRPSPHTWHCAPLQCDVRKSWRQHHQPPWLLYFYSHTYHRWVRGESRNLKALNRYILKSYNKAPQLHAFIHLSCAGP